MRDRKYVIHGGESAEAYAEPSGTPVVWSIVHKSKDLENVQIGGDSGIVTVPPDTKNGCITIRATHRDLSCCFREMTVDIGCKCSDCDRKGTASAELGCIDLRFAMGNSKGGKPAGDIFLRADEPSPLLSTPAALRFSPLADDVTPVYGDTGILRQIIAPETVADIVVTDGSAYSIIFYDVSGDSVTTDGDSQVNKPYYHWNAGELKVLDGKKLSNCVVFALEAVTVGGINIKDIGNPLEPWDLAHHSSFTKNNGGAE